MLNENSYLSLFRNTVAITALILFSLLPGCATNQVTGKRELALVSESYEISVGNEQYRPGQQLQGGIYYLDKDLTEYINKVGKRLANISDRDLPYDFKILNNSIPNAWALPGGKIAINRGLLTELHSESELAAVLSHEIVHAAARHGAKNMEKGMLLGAAIIATALLTENEDYGLLAVEGAQLAANLIAQKYSRSTELEADNYSMHYMAKAGYDPKGAIDLQQTFLKLSGNKKTDWLSGLFASHPPSIERLQANKQTAIELNATGGEIGEERYKNKIAYLLKTSPAYNKYDNARISLKNGNTDNAQMLVENAIQIEPNEALFYGLQGDVFFKRSDFRSAIDEYDKAIELNYNYFYFFEKRGLAYKQIGNLNKARLDLTACTNRLPTAIAHNGLGEIALREGKKYEAKRQFLAASSSNTVIGKNALASYTKLDFHDNPKKYIQIDRKDNDGDKAQFAVVNRSPIPVHKIDLVASFTDNNGHEYALPHQIKRILHAREYQIIVIESQAVPVEYQDSLKLDLISVEPL